MFYYAELNSTLAVTAIHALNAESTNANYVAITEDQYTNGNLVGKYYNKLTGSFEALDIENVGYIGDTIHVQVYGTAGMLLSTKLDNMQVDMDGKADAGDLSEVATSGSYNDLTDKPNIPAAYTHPASHPASMITGLSTVATSGSYNDLSDKPTIPTVPTSLPANGGDADTVDGKHASDFATASHNHDADYAEIDHTHTQYAAASHTHSDYASATHDHDEDYAAVGHTHDYAGASHTHAQSEITGLATALSGKANATHTHADYVTTDDFSALETTVSGKANASHTHSQYANATDVEALETEVAGKADASHTHTQYAAANHTHSDYVTNDTYTDGMDGKANATHTHAQSDITGLATALSGKANTSHSHSDYALQTDLDTLSDVVDGKAASGHTHTAATTSAAGFMSAADKTKLNGIATGANAYTHPSYTAKSSGLYKVTVDATGHVSAATAVAKSDITALGIPSTNTTYSNATTSAAGLMSASDKSKLDGIASGANAYTLPTASSTLGGVKTTSTVTSASGYTACPIISGVPYYKDTNTTYNLSSFGITATAAELNKMDGVTATASEINKLDGLTATTTELNYVDGVTSNIQTQLNGKAASSHTHSDYFSVNGGTINGDTNVAGVLRVQGNQAYYYNSSSVTQVIGTNNATGGTTICNGTNANMYINGANLMTPNCLPRTTGTYYCGNANYRWKGIYSAAAVNVSSDERLKENIEPINVDEAVKLINEIDVKSFNYIGSDEPQIGAMAQDIIAKAPELAKALVTEGEDGYYGVKTSDLIFPLIVAVQKLTARVKELEEMRGK